MMFSHLLLLLCVLFTKGILLVSPSTTTHGVAGNGAGDSGGKKTNKHLHDHHINTIPSIQKLTPNARCLIISIDNRHLKPDYHAKDYTSMTSVITHAYADFHHYDYLYLQNNITALEQEVSRLFSNIVIDPNMDRKAVAKDLATAIHIGYLEYRAASWAKLPVLWYVAAHFQDLYDYVWYIDSDATISPLQLDRSIEDTIALWSQSPENVFPEIVSDPNGKGKGSKSGTFVGRTMNWKGGNSSGSNGEKGKRIRIKFNQYNQRDKQSSSSTTSSISTTTDNLQTNFVQYGQKDITKAHFIFFNNFPWRDNMPCAGSFIFRPTKLAERVFRQWWDFHLTSKNFKHFHEQDALWHMIESEYWIDIYRQRNHLSPLSSLVINENSPGWKTIDTPEAKEWLEAVNYQPIYLLNSSTYSIVTEEQFPSAFTRYEDLWLTHIASYNYQYRMPILYHYLRVLGIDELSYVTKVNHVNSKEHTKVLQPLGLCLEMERRSKIEDELYSKGGSSVNTLSGKSTNTVITTWKGEGYKRVSIWPKHNEVKQHEWYDEHVTSHNSLALSPSELHEGRLVRRKGEFWMISQGKKHSFESFQAFLSLGLYDDVAIHLRPDEIHAIPDGHMISTNGISIPKSNSIPLIELEKIERERFNLLKQYLLINKNNKQSVIGYGRQAETFEEAIVMGIIPSFSSLASLPSSSGSIAVTNTSITATSTTTTSTTATSKHGHSHPSTACTRDEELEKLLVTSGTRAKLIIISHSDESEKLVEEFITCQQGKEWIQSLRITSTVYFESILYALLHASSTTGSNNDKNGNTMSKDVNSIDKKAITSLLTLSATTSNTSPVALPTLPYFNIEQYDYIITATYKTITKQLHYNGFTQSMSMISTYLQFASQEQYDVIPFLRSGSKMMEFATYFHGSGFQIAWDQLLLAMGYTLTEIRSFDNEKVVFYRNIFLIKPKILASLSLFMTKAMIVAKENESVAKALGIDSKYKEGSLEVAKRIFGTSYYQLHPFIFERLPSFYLFITKAKICTGSTGPCKYNS